MAGEQRVPNVWVVRADGGAETQNCVDGGFTGIGWSRIGDLSDAVDMATIASRWLRVAHRNDKASTIRSTIGNISRFLFDIQIGDWVITPEADHQSLRYGQVIGNYWHDASGRDDCRYDHRRDVLWRSDQIDRYALSRPFQGTLGSQLTVFQVRHKTEFFKRIGFVVRRSGQTTGD